MKLDPKYWDALRASYIKFGKTSDRLCRDPEDLARFTRDFAGRIGHAVDPESVADTLYHLRKSKKETGGLPRLGRGRSRPSDN